MISLHRDMLVKDRCISEYTVLKVSVRHFVYRQDIEFGKTNLVERNNKNLFNAETHHAILDAGSV